MGLSFLRQMIVVLAALAFLATAQTLLAASAADAVIAEVGAALEAGDAAHALQLADGALKAEPTALQRGRLLLDHGLAQELLGDRKAALVAFTDALQTRALPPPERAQALLQRGFMLDGENKLRDAARDYGAVIALKAGAVATALNNRANIYRRQHKLVDAKRDYLAALAAGSEKPQYPYFGLGQIAEAHSDVEAAKGFYVKALTADPDYRLAADRLASLGGPSEGALAEPDKIVLHPPGINPALAPPAGAPPADQPITPHPSAKARQRPGPAGAASPRLRPALDGPSKGGQMKVQLGAWRSEPEAQAGWDRARGRASGVLDGLAAHVVQADLPGKGRYFRLQVVTPAPTAFCAGLRKAGVACLPVR